MVLKQSYLESNPWICYNYLWLWRAKTLHFFFKPQGVTDYGDSDQKVWFLNLQATIKTIQNSKSPKWSISKWKIYLQWVLMSAIAQRHYILPLVWNMDHTFKIGILFLLCLSSLKEKIKQVKIFKLIYHNVYVKFIALHNNLVFSQLV